MSRVTIGLIVEDGKTNIKSNLDKATQSDIAVSIIQIDILRENLFKCFKNQMNVQEGK